MKNISLSILDEYAKRLSQKQVNMLYENRMNKKYSKKVFEGSEDIFEDDFVLYITNKDIEEAGFTPASLIAEVQDKDLKYNVTETGVYFYTELPNIYNDLIISLDGMDIDYADVTNV